MNAIWKILAKIFLSDPDKIQAFLLSIIGKINVTDKPVLSMIVEALKAIIQNDEAWELLYDLVISLFNDNTTEVRGDIVTARANAIASVVGGEDTKIDPATIIMIITAVVELIKMWRDRKNK